MSDDAVAAASDSDYGGRGSSDSDAESASIQVPSGWSQAPSSSGIVHFGA